MNKHINRIIALVAIFCISLGESLSAQYNSKVSVLTCEPGSVIYTLFGHTAFRYQNYERGIDVVYNYGLFDFYAPNFELRYALGQTDYMLGRTTFASFANAYRRYGRRIWEQEVIMSEAERDRLFALLEENCLPENMVYRYNYFFDNCATRIVDKIEEAIGGKIILAPTKKESFRDMVYKYAGTDNWSSLSMSVCIGYKADRVMTDRERCFVPMELMNAFEKAKVVRGGEEQQLCAEKTIVVEPEHIIGFQKEQRFSPIFIFLILLVFSVVLTIYEYRKGRYFWVYDTLLYALVAIAGSILSFLFFFSEHPTTSTNLLVIVCNPLVVILALTSAIKSFRNKLVADRVIYGTVVAIFILLSWLLPQTIDFAVVLALTTVLLRTVSSIFINKRIKTLHHNK